MDAFPCTHGSDAAECPKCAEIRCLLAEDDGPVGKATVYDERIEEREARRRSRGPKEPAVRLASIPHLTEILPSQEHAFEARRLGAVTEREASVIAAYLQVREKSEQKATLLGARPDLRTVVGTPERLGWAAAARLAGCSRQTARRVFRAAARRLCQPGAAPMQVRIVRRYKTRIRGEWRTEMWTEYEARLGTAWSRRWLALGESQQAGVPTSERRLVAIPPSPMNVLAAALLEAFAGRKPSAGTAVVRQSPDWCRNLAWATRRLRSTGRKVIPTDVGEIFRLVVRGCRLCVYCHAPILAGCWLDGHRVNRSRTSCSAACKMASRRRRNRQPEEGVRRPAEDASPDVGG